MKIEQYISQLLYRYQCVTVPGFGAFLTELQSAQVDENSHSFYPPKKMVSFNPFIKNNDGLLANHLAEAEKISYEIAVSIIQNEVSHWKTKIQEFGSFSVKNVGDFSLNSEKNIVFVPVDQINYLTASFGLSSFISPSVKREVYKEDIQQLEEKAPIIFTPDRRRNYSVLKYAAIFLLSAGVAGTVGYKYYENKIAQETLIVETNVQKKINQKIQEATFYISNPLPAVTLSVPSENTPYCVVAGAFRIESNAEEQYQRLLKLGFKKAKRLAPNKHGLFPVLYGSYSTYSEAHQAMKDIQKLDNKDAWLLIEAL
ncbi:SPOR domain-containing protein [Flavobacterium paronense]|uniref:SPOR domain-containing protein n=1 Tax=Flavobacterium paronense TaxID=1392775 RepID=A0ABV5GEN1_9FLAO|nr:SPOR domain-containing protein [Flavobacterium paronense]MDN3678390.1 SPOR domain-containing protein [Flavobacterium paronense]